VAHQNGTGQEGDEPGDDRRQRRHEDLHVLVRRPGEESKLSAAAGFQTNGDYNFKHKWQ
jgi:hypothetical protein